MSWIFIEAEDVWFFRDPRSFGKGEDHLARCIFPPFPFTLAGALRSAIIGEQPDWSQARFNAGLDPDLYARIGKLDDLGPHFSIRGPFLARMNAAGQAECYAPVPADAFIEDPQQSLLGCFQPNCLPGLAANWPADGISPLWPPSGERKDAPENGLWLSGSAFGRYQNAGQFVGEPEGTFFDQENRIGIGRDLTTGSAQDHMLYSAPFIRLCAGTGLLVWVAGEARLPEAGMLALGGEGRAAHYRTLSEAQVELLPDVDVCGKTRVKVILQTPAYFEAGWQPADGNWSGLGLPAGAHLRAAALGRPQIVNGWDIARGRQKMLRSFVPAGSVYDFEWDQPLQSNLDPAQITFTESPATETYSRLGLGQVTFGLWNWAGSS